MILGSSFTKLVNTTVNIRKHLRQDEPANVKLESRAYLKWGHKSEGISHPRTTTVKYKPVKYVF